MINFDVISFHLFQHIKNFINNAESSIIMSYLVTAYYLIFVIFKEWKALLNSPFSKMLNKLFAKITTDESLKKLFIYFLTFRLVSVNCALLHLQIELSYFKSVSSRCLLLNWFINLNTTGRPNSHYFPQNTLQTKCENPLNVRMLHLKVHSVYFIFDQPFMLSTLCRSLTAMEVVP